MEFLVDSKLTNVERALIVEAGLTFILYQRGQIPLPYQQLEKSALIVGQGEEGKSELRGYYGGGGLENGDLSCCDNGEINPRERIMSMLKERKKRSIQYKLQKQRKLALIAEAKAYNNIQPALQTLCHLLEICGRTPLFHEARTNSGMVSVVLVLGPSVYCPKEIFCFDLNACSSYTNNERQSPKQFQNTVMRQFYKAVITNPDLLDFTSKPLSKTYTHICVLTPEKLKSLCEKQYDVTRLPTIPPSLLQLVRSSTTSSSLNFSVSNDGNSVEEETPIRLIHSTSSNKLKHKLFRIKINDRQQNLSMNCTSCESSSYSNDILFDINNSYSCYQISLRFRGIQCKNKM